MKNKDKISRKIFVPSDDLSYLYMELLRDMENDKEPKEVLVAGGIPSKKFNWKLLKRQIRRKFQEESLLKCMNSQFVFFAQKLQKNGNLSKGYYSEEGRFSDSSLSKISQWLEFDVDLCANNDLLKRFGDKLYEEFTSFLKENSFKTRIFSVYMENNRIAVSRLIDFPFPDFDKILNSEEGWEND